MKNYLILSFLLCSIPFFAQPAIEWQKSIGGSNYDLAINTIQTNDGGYITVAYSSSNDNDISGNHGGFDIVAIKLTNAGVIEWQKSYGGSGSDTASSIQQTTDGGYIIVGTTTSNNGDVSGNHGGDDYWVVKITNLGIIEWQKCFGGSNGDSATTIQQTSDGGYIVGGSASSVDGDVTGIHNPIGSSGSSDYWILKLTNTGSIVWKKCLGSTSSDYLYSIKQTSDGGYILNGDIQANDGDVTGHHGDFDFWVVKLNSTGVIEWQKALGGTNWDTGLDVIQNSDGDYIAVGFSSSTNGDISGTHGGGDGWVVKLNGTGNLIWQKALGGTGSDFLQHVQQTLDGGYIFSGDSTSNDGQAPFNHGPADSSDCWVVKTTSSGDFEWGKLFGGSDEDTGVNIIQTPDSGYLVSSYSYSADGDLTSNYGLNDIWLVKLSSALGNPSSEFENAIVLYPNPANDIINLNLGKNYSTDLWYSIYDQQSRIVLRDKLPSNCSAVSIKNLETGVYFFKIDNAVAGIKFIKN